MADDLIARLRRVASSSERLQVCELCDEAADTLERAQVLCEDATVTLTQAQARLDELETKIARIVAVAEE